MKHYVPPRIDAEQARRFFVRRRWGNLFGLVRGAAPALVVASRPRQLPCMERVWIPHYQLDYRVVSHAGRGEVSISLDACSGCFAFFQMHAALVEGDLDEECLPTLISEADAERQGRRDLLNAILRRRGQRGKPVIEDMLSIRVFYYPFWVCYFRRWRRFIDIRLQDAYSGERGGNRTRQGVLNAFVAMRNAGQGT